MKKILSIAMTLCMVLMLIPMTLVSVSAETPTVSKTLLDFEDNDTSVLQWASDGKSSIQANADLNASYDWTYWTEDAGNYSALINGKSQWAGFKLPTDWYTGGYDVGEFHYTNPSAISFDVSPTTRNLNTKSVKFNKVAFYKQTIGWDTSYQVVLTPDDSSTIAIGTKRTVVCPIPKGTDLSEIKRFAVNLDAGSTNILIDNIKLIYNTAYVASFSGTETATLSDAVDNQLQTMGVADASITLPDATLSDGEFAGWVTKQDPTTIIPAGTKYVMEEDTTFYAVSSTRPVGPAPEAPTLESATGTTITLTAVDGYEYKMNDGDWQTSNVFTDLTIDTKYTFYARYANSPAYLVGPSSEGAVFETEPVFELEAETMKLTSDTGVSLTIANQTDGVSGYQNYVTWNGNFDVGKSGTLTGTDYKLPAGIYEITTWGRCLSSRSAFTVTGTDGTGDAQDLGVIDFGDVSGKLAGTSYYTLNKVANQFTIKDASTISLKFTVSTKRSGTLWIDKILFTKVADLPADDPLAVDVSTEAGASIRLGKVNGIRFYTKVDQDKIAALQADGATVEMGTLIAPADLLGNEELSFDLDESKYVDVKYAATDDENGAYIYYTEGDFTGIVGSIGKIKESNTSWSSTSGNVTRDFVSRGYVKVTKGDDVTISYANFDSTNARSLKTVASAIDTGSEFYQGLSTEQQGFVDTWASAVR